jgi:hypothetical protein
MFALTLKPGITTSIPPDVCKMPSPAGPIPTPLVNIFQMNQANPGTLTQKVKVNGAQAYNAQTKIQMSTGDEAGSLGGVVSNMIIGPASYNPAGASKKVMFEGKPALPIGSQTFQNGDASFNTTGISAMPTQAVVIVN